MKKSMKMISFGLWVMVALLVSAPTVAQDWQSTSSMAGSGSAYGAQVAAVGAASVTEMATTTESYSPAKSGIRKAPPTITPGTESGYDPANPQFSPLGDAVLPLLLMALLFAGITYLRTTRKRTL